MDDEGFLYLGEWHTHPEPRPRGSPEDIASFRTLNRRSSFRVSSTLMLIQGTSPGVPGLALYSFGGDGMHTWQLKLEPHEEPAGSKPLP
jgi:hypothetical protein